MRSANKLLNTGSFPGLWKSRPGNANLIICVFWPPDYLWNWGSGKVSSWNEGLKIICHLPIFGSSHSASLLGSFFSERG